MDLKSITFTVRKSYQNDDVVKLLRQNNVDINEFILNVGSAMYLKHQFLSTDVHSQEMITELQKEIERITDKSRKEVDQIQRDHKQQQDFLRSQILDLQQQYSKESDAYFLHLREEFHKKEIKYKDDILLLNTQKEGEYEQKFMRERLEYQSKIQELQEQNTELEKTKTLDVTTSLCKGRELAEQEFQKYIDIHKQIILDLESRLLQVTEEKNDLIKKMIELPDRHTGIFENKLEKIESGILNIERVFKDNSSKCNFSENKLEHILSYQFPDGKLFDTSNQPQSGDIHFHYRSCKMMIECKFVQHLRKEDIDKFYRDIDLLTQQCLINCALLVSFHNTNLPHGNRHFWLEFKHHIPVVFISNVLANEGLLRNTILMINNLVQNNITQRLEDDDDEKLQYIGTCILKLNQIINKQLSSLDKERKMIDMMVSSHQQKRSDMTELYNIIDSMFRKFPELSMEQPLYTSSCTIVDQKFDQFIQGIKKIKEENTNFIIKADTILQLDIAKSLNITPYNIKKWTIVKIKEAVEYNALST